MTDCDTLLDAPPEERRRHLEECPACAQMMQALTMVAAPPPLPLTDDFQLRLTLALERPDPIAIWVGTVRRVRQGLTAAAAVIALITAGWVAREVPAATQLTEHQIQLAVNRAGYR